MALAFYAGQLKKGGFGVLNMRGQQISKAFVTIEGAISCLNTITGAIAEHRHCEDCSAGFVTGKGDVLCPQCRPKSEASNA